jgi:signal transduction histidine kinase
MLDGVPGPVTAKQRRLLELTNQSARRLSSMITKILDLSAMEAGALALETGVHEVRALVEPALDTLALGDPERRPFIVTELPESPLLIECDRDRIVQVLVNLLENAVKFSPRGAPVYVTARLAGSRDPTVPVVHWKHLPRPGASGAAALIEVHDRGPGVPEADKRRIFEHFFQSSSGNRVSARGVGLGLAICREIVDLHGGAIWVRSNPQGGSTFVVLLPRASAGAVEIPARSAADLQTISAKG